MDDHDYGRRSATRMPAEALIQPIFLFELAGQAGLGQVAEVLVGQRVELVLEAGREHPLDLFLPVLLLAIRSLSNARLVNLVSCRSAMDGIIDVLVRHGD